MVQQNVERNEKQQQHTIAESGGCESIGNIGVTTLMDSYHNIEREEFVQKQV